MQHKNTTTVFDKLYFPKKLNHEYVEEYFASKSLDCIRDMGLYNNGDKIERNVEISNYLYKRLLAKNSKKLENKRKEYNDKRKQVKEQWDDLKEKESKLRQNFMTFNKFVKENQEKKERAAIKIIEQTELRDERDKRTVELSKRCEEITNIKKKMDENIHKYRIYESFLNDVVDNSDPSMQTINDLLKRYEALIGARKELNDIQQRDMMKLEKAKSNLKLLTEDYWNRILSLSNHVNMLQHKYERARQECVKWENIHKYIKFEAVEKVIDIVAIKESCRKMYLEICKRKNCKPIYEDDMERQLLVIKQAIGEYEIINGRVKGIEEKAFKDSIVPNPSGSS